MGEIKPLKIEKEGLQDRAFEALPYVADAIVKANVVTFIKEKQYKVINNLNGTEIVLYVISKINDIKEPLDETLRIIYQLDDEATKNLNTGLRVKYLKDALSNKDLIAFFKSAMG